MVFNIFDREKPSKLWIVNKVHAIPSFAIWGHFKVVCGQPEPTYVIV
jgi:hypothetical protein